MKKHDSEEIDDMDFIPLKELLMPDNDEIKKLKSLYGLEADYINFLGPIEFFIANYGLINKKLKDQDVKIALRNIRDHWNENFDFFKSDLEKNIMCTISALLQDYGKITSYELLLVIKHILWALDNRKWMNNPRAYIDWIANFFGLLDKDEKIKFDKSYLRVGQEYGLDKKELARLKGEDLDYELPPSEVLMSKIDSETFDKKENCDEPSLWSEGSYAHSLSSSDLSEEKMKYFAGDPQGEPKEHNCKKCNISIGKHNLYWHEGMCDNCFFDTYKM